MSSLTSCSELTDVYCLAVFSPKITGYYKDYSLPFYNSHIEYATLHVPEASISDYQGNDVWKGFGTIVTLTPEDTGISSTSTIDREVLPSICNSNGVMIVVTGRDFRANQAKYVGFAQKGEDVVVKSRFGTWRVVPISSDDIVVNTERTGPPRKEVPFIVWFIKLNQMI